MQVKKLFFSKRVKSSPNRKLLRFEAMEERCLMAGIQIIETVDRTIINDNGRGADFYDISLDTQPSSAVTINLTSSSPTTGTWSLQNFTSQVVFTPNDWSPKTVAVFGRGDSIVTGNFTAVYGHSISTNDPNYQNTTIRDVIATVIDTDSQIGLPTYDYVLSEGQSSIFFDGALYPTAYSGQGLSASYDTAQIRIESLNGSGSTLTLTAINDGIPEGVQDVPLNYGTAPGYFVPTAIVRISDAITARFVGYQINGGEAQRSVVSSIRLNFSAPIVVIPNLITLTNTNTNTNIPLQMSVTDNGLSLSITFLSGTGVITRLNGNSLTDGRYILNVPQSSISHRSSLVPLSEDVIIGDQASDGLFRLYGDLNGNASLDKTDIQAFNRAFRTSVGNSSYIAALDELGDGYIGVDDQTKFRKNIRK